MKFLETALQISRQILPNSPNKCCHAAFIFERNKLLSIGQNDMQRTSGKAAYFGRRYNIPQFVEYAFAHAEIDAIARIWSKIRIDNRMKLVVVRLGQSGRLRNSKPCNKCQTILDALGLNKIWWSTEEGIVNE